MDLLSEEEIKSKTNFSFAPMIDFLFLMLALFATLALSRSSLFDSEIALVQGKSPREGEKNISNSDRESINLSINQTGEYRWMTDLNSYSIDDITALQQEIVRQYEMGLLPKDKSQTEVLLHIDKSAPWEPIAKAIFAIKEIGFQVSPIYESE